MPGAGHVPGRRDSLGVSMGIRRSGSGLFSPPVDVDYFGKEPLLQGKQGISLKRRLPSGAFGGKDSPSAFCLSPNAG